MPHPEPQTQVMPAALQPAPVAPAAPQPAPAAPAAPQPAPTVPAATQLAADRRSMRTRRALRDALAAEIREAGGLDRVAVTSIAQRADVTRRTFYLHYHDIPDLVEASEADLLEGLRQHIEAVAATTLVSLRSDVSQLRPCPGSVELLEYIRENGDCMSALLGPGGDPAFVQKIKALAADTVRDRVLHGIDVAALGAFFEYYLAFATSAILGVLQRWLEGGMEQPPEVMARVVTLLMFVRPGDLYGQSIDLNIPMYMQLFQQLKEI